MLSRKVKCESVKAVSVMGGLTIQGYLHNSGRLLVLVFFPINQFEEVSNPVVCRSTVEQYCKPDQWNYIGFKILPILFYFVHCRDLAHPLALYLSDPVARLCYSLSWWKITHWRFRKIIQTDERDRKVKKERNPLVERI